MENDIQKNERMIFIINGFDRIKIEEIDFYFNQKFSTWIYRESDKKERLSDDKYLNYDKEGKLIECSYSGTKEGFELTEKDFIEKELMLLDKVKYDLLNLKNRKQFTFYKEYLNKRNSEAKFTGEYPLPFTSSKAYKLFLELVKQFGIGENNMANYSYVYWNMAQSGLIDRDLKHIPFLKLLRVHKIDIDRLHAEFKKLGNLPNKEKAFKIAESELIKSVL